MDRDELRAAAQPKAVRAAIKAAGDLTGAGHHEHGALTSVRTATHRGHEIVVRTTYEITVDGQSFDVALTVDNSGRVHYHGLPTRDFGSAIALVKKAIDQFPDDFPPPHDPGAVGEHGGDHHGGHH
jgi:hypothetical protein